MKKIMCFILAILAAFAATGCASENDYEGIKPTENPLIYGGEIDPRYETSAWRTEVAGEYLIGGYESEFEMKNFSIIHPAVSFGKLSISEEQKTVGQSSLKIEFEGNGKLYPDNQEESILTIPTKDSTAEGETYRLDMLTDYTDYSKIKFDFYSGQEDSCVLFYMNVAIDTHTKWRHYAFYPQQGWNSIEIPLTYENFYDTEGNHLAANVENFGFGFGKYQLAGQVQTFYLDNFRVTKE